MASVFVDETAPDSTNGLILRDSFLAESFQIYAFVGKAIIDGAINEEDIPVKLYTQ